MTIPIRYGQSHYKDKSAAQSCDHLIFTMGFPILQLDAVIAQSNISRSTGVAQNINQNLTTQKKTPYLALMGELRCVYCKDLGENRPCYNGTALYSESIFHTKMTPCMALRKSTAHPHLLIFSQATRTHDKSFNYKSALPCRKLYITPVHSTISPPEDCPTKLTY